MEAAAAGYGRACVNCSRAKCKCMVQAGGTCERCKRLGKDCTPASFVRKRRERTTATKRARLEDKLDSLVTLLQAQQPAPPSSSGPEVGNTVPQPRSLAEFVAENAFSEPSVLLSPPQSDQSISPNSGINSNIRAISEDEEFLDSFRTGYLCFFPFANLDDTTAAKISEDRPFFWATIKVVCTESTSTKIKLATQAKGTLAARLIMDGERSIDILLGLLTIMTCSYFFNGGKPLLIMYSNIAKGIISELNIDRIVVESLVSTISCSKPGYFPDPAGGATAPACTKEERRALLACFIICAMNASCLRGDNMAWSPKMEESCRVLMESSEMPGDTLLATIARISKVAADAAEVIRRASEDADYAKAAMLQIKPLWTSYEQLKSSLPSEVLSHNVVSSHLNSAEVLIYEIALYVPSASTFNQIMDMKRIEYFTACLHAAKACMENFLRLDIVIADMVTMLTFSHSMQVVHRLCLIECTGWDRAAAKATADPIYYLRSAVALSEQANIMIKAKTGEDSLFLKAASAMSQAIPMWDAPLEKVAGTEPTAGEAIDSSLLDLPDDFWLPDIFTQYWSNPIQC